MNDWITIHSVGKEVVLKKSSILYLRSWGVEKTEITLLNGDIIIADEDYTEVKAEMFI